MIYKLIRCKSSQNVGFQLNSHGSLFHTECKCGALTSYDKSYADDLFHSHFDFFEVKVTGKYFTDEGYKQAVSIVSANPENYMRKDE